MTWNIRIVHHRNIIPAKKSITKKKMVVDWYALHEVYYNKKGKPYMLTTEPRSIVGDTPAEVREYVLMCMKAMKVRIPILDYDTRKECQHHLHSSQK
jgi:hypothetical protein